MRDNKKVLDLKKNIKEAKKKIREQKKIIRKEKIKEFKKSKFGKYIGKVLFIFSDKDYYTFSEMFAVTIISLIVGVFACFSVFTIVSGGRNYFKVSKQLKKFYDVYDVLIDNYNGDIDEDELIENAINGMVSGVDDIYTSYSSPSKTDNFNEMVSGTYEGIGCTIQQVDNAIRVVEVYEKSPAFKAGLKADDVIKSVDSIEAIKLGTSKLAEYIKNEAKGKVTMVIVRGEEEKTLVLERSKVEIPTVSSKVFTKNDKKIGYIRIGLFSSVADKQFKNKLAEMEKENIKGLVIDVRDNNGGYLSTVTNIASMLLPKGKVIYQVSKDDKKVATKDKTSEKREYPIAIITNESSASASEILAAAIKESYKGFVVGEKTYGKGTVQQVKKLSDGSMIKYTVENWLTPDGNWINEKGVEPTNKVSIGEKYIQEPNEENDMQIQKALELVSE